MIMRNTKQNVPQDMVTILQKNEGISSTEGVTN
ncbi:hypothetical protein BH18THE2_BH18THE2_43850 [soil metagenome]